MSTSIIIPCLNEENAIADTVDSIMSALTKAEMTETEVIVVDDGSTDGTPGILKSLQMTYGTERLNIVTHTRRLGYGAALKTGIRRSNADYILITDADGTYPNARIPEFINLAKRYDMIVGARTSEEVEYSRIRSIPKMVLVPWVSMLCGSKVPDMNSGFRAFRRDVGLRFLNLLPDGFSFTTTITICMLRNRYHVGFEPISYKTRIGKSHIKPIRDTLRFIQLITRTGMYFAPLRLFLPLLIALSVLTISSFAFDALVLENLTDKSVFLAATTLNVGIFALLADMIDKRTS